LDLVFGALDHVDVDASQRKIVWPDGKRLSIEEAAERLHAEYPDIPRDLIETHVFGRPEKSSRELGTLQRRGAVANSFARTGPLSPFRPGASRISPTCLLGSGSVARETDRLLARGGEIVAAAEETSSTSTSPEGRPDRGKQPRFVSMTPMFD